MKTAAFLLISALALTTALAQQQCTPENDQRFQGKDDFVCGVTPKTQAAWHGKRVPYAGQKGQKGDYCMVAKWTYKEAKRICKKAGARLCTFEEMKNGEASGSGCRGGSKLHWTSTECGKGRKMTHRLAYKSGGRGGCPKFNKRRPTKAFVTCCTEFIPLSGSGSGSA